MSGWAMLALAFMVFLGSHAIPMQPRIRGPLIGLLGRGGYLLAYSLLSLALLYALILATNAAPRIALWGPAAWQRWLVNLTMPLAVGLAVFGAGAPNPLGTGGRTTGFDPDRPGIVAVTRQPLMWAFALWAGAHLVANGDLAHVIFFGSMLVFAVGGIAAAEARARRLPDFAALSRRTGLVPGGALLRGRWRPRSLPSLPRLVLTVVIWAALLALHPPLVGVVATP